ncbi:MAG TPA: prephenate dehydrogenase/arogenate dehydrogenase family protein [Solirubrobacteraceae bacterium]|jgi:prephenate dehydrogenase|nr:prephenate dehydrogenase/arogenate dehydrogenase family protein [Solirubrobacteraceae bacterium]
MRVAVIGVGLIGGSVALAARERLGAHVSAWDLNPAALSKGRSLGVIDSATRSLDDAVHDADGAFVAAPVDSLPELVAAVLARAPEGCVVSDVGSTKRSVVAACADPRFVGGHPLAGSEMSGVEHARAGLFDGATWYLTPSQTTSATSLSRVRDLVTALGAKPVEIGAATHDQLMASVSHLPHIFANVLVSQVAAIGGARELGPSFRDATRVAGANAAIWNPIYFDNREPLVVAIEDAIARLSGIADALRQGDEGRLASWSEQAIADRERLGR